MKLENITVDALGKSGKISIQKSIKRDNTTEINKVTLDFSSLKELDINGTEVGKSGSFKHSFNNFATLDFTISETSEVLYQNLTAFSFNIYANKVQGNSTKFTARLFIFNQTGEIKNGNETSNVQPGTVKLSLDIENWQFCKKDAVCPGDNCCEQGQNKEIGQYLEFVMAIKGNKIAKQNGNNKLYSLGGSDLILFDNIQADESWTSMPVGYPKYSLNNQTSVEEFAFRFPVFNKKLSYDPLIKYENEDVKSSSNVLLYVIIVILGLIVIGSGVFFIMKKRNQQRNSQAFIEK